MVVPTHNEVKGSSSKSSWLSTVMVCCQEVQLAVGSMVLVVVSPIDHNSSNLVEWVKESKEDVLNQTLRWAIPWKQDQLKMQSLFYNLVVNGHHMAMEVDTLGDQWGKWARYPQGLQDNYDYSIITMCVLLYLLKLVGQQSEIACNKELVFLLGIFLPWKHEALCAHGSPWYVVGL